LKILPGCPQFAGDSESQPRNAFYLQNIARMMQIFRQTGLNVRLGSLSPEIKVPTPVLCRMVRIIAGTAGTFRQRTPSGTE
jgi:hypothetical protein